MLAKQFSAKLQHGQSGRDVMLMGRLDHMRCQKSATSALFSPLPPFIFFFYIPLTCFKNNKIASIITLFLTTGTHSGYLPSVWQKELEAVRGLFKQMVLLCFG